MLNKEGRAKLKVGYTKEQLAAFNLDLMLESKKAETLETVVIDLDAKGFAEAIERSETASDYVGFNKHRRIITAVVVVLDHELTQSFKTVFKGSADIVVEGFDKGTLDITLKKGATTKKGKGLIVGYEMSQVYWRSHDKISDIVADLWGSTQRKPYKGEYLTRPQPRP